MPWANLGRNPFSFGNLSAAQQTLYENQPDIPYQQLMNYWGGGQAGFENTVLGRFLRSQQQSMFNNFIAQQAADPGAGLTWTKFLEGQQGSAPQQFNQLPGFMRGVNPGQFRIKRELW